VLRGVSVLATPARPAYPYFIEKHVFLEPRRSLSGGLPNPWLAAQVLRGFRNLN
jgi:hypothetical protein